MGSIQWTDETWNPVTGCSKVSTGCKNCYAEKMAERLQKMGQPNYRDGFAVRAHRHMLYKPLEWKRPRRIFVNSMSDLFHVEVPGGFIFLVFDIMRQAHWHQFQVLTKRPDRMRQWVHETYGGENPGPNIWLGTSVENNKTLSRITDLSMTPAAVRFVSFEPLLEDVVSQELAQAMVGHHLHWAIIGGESGPGARPCDPRWVSNLTDFLTGHGTTVFVKQLGAVWAKQSGAKDAKGGNPDEWPEALRVREFPEVSRG